MDSERKLTNEDFRKLFMTPRHPGDSGSKRSSESSSTSATPKEPETFATPRSGDKDKRRLNKKKHFLSKTKKEEEDPLAELSRRYRDRAKERRDGGHPDQQREELLTAQGAYRAVAPDFRANEDAAERRKQMIQESKFLGGDIEHTHLVKGLDYALLQKVRSELQNEENDNEVHEEVEITKEKSKEQKPTEEQESHFHSKLARNVHRVLFKSSLPERNELFIPGRTAYVFELEDEYAESDLPTTLIRSKADVPLAEGQATLTTNDIVINKLAQILSYLRQGSKSSKKQKRNKDGRASSPVNRHDKHERKDSRRKDEDDSIYGDIGDYVPKLTKDRQDSKREKDRKKVPYFEKPADEDEKDSLVDPKMFKQQGQKQDREAWNPEGEKGEDMTFGSMLKKDDRLMSRSQKLLKKINAQPEGYNECYPGFDEMHDAMDDSDEETDYSKMDPGKKKGTVGRWDFDTMEEYSDYMSNKEALPKAAFQFGVKMNDGRKTRKGQKGEKNEKAQLDRQWQQIQNIIEKRKASGSSREGGSEAKIPRKS